MTKVILRYFTLVLIVIAVSSCSHFRKVQKSGDWKKKYEAAIEYYEEGDYYKASLLIEAILPEIRGTDEAEKANFYLPYCYFYQKQYILSAHYFQQFTQVYGRSEYLMEAAYQYANSLYMQSPIYSLDQTPTKEAIAALQNFLNRYPNSEFAESADKQIQELQVKLERKAYEIAKLYFKLERYKAANVVFNNFQTDFPDSKYNEEIAYLAVESMYNLAEISVYSKREERYAQVKSLHEELVDKYPDSKYLKDAEKFYSKSIEQLHIFADRKKLQAEKTEE